MTRNWTKILRAFWKRRRSIGHRGERMAARHLKRRGLRILGRNRHIADVEIDILAYDPKSHELVIVEVKTSTRCTNPTRRINRKKRKRLLRAARLLSTRHRVRVEAIGVTLEPTVTVQHYGHPRAERSQSGR